MIVNDPLSKGDNIKFGYFSYFHGILSNKPQTFSIICRISTCTFNVFIEEQQEVSTMRSKKTPTTDECLLHQPKYVKTSS